MKRALGLLLVLIVGASACKKEGKVCEEVELPEDFAGDEALEELAGSGVLCKADARSFKIQLPKAESDDAWMETVKSTKATLEEAGWKSCARRSEAKYLQYEEGFLRENEGLTISVSGRTDGVIWAGSQVYFALYRHDPERDPGDLINLVCSY